MDSWYRSTRFGPIGDGPDERYKAVLARTLFDLHMRYVMDGIAVTLHWSVAPADETVDDDPDFERGRQGRRRESDGGRALAVRRHVGDWELCDALVDAAVAEFGRLDVLVNNAGIAPCRRH